MKASRSLFFWCSLVFCAAYVFAGAVFPFFHDYPKANDFRPVHQGALALRAATGGPYQHLDPAIAYPPTTLLVYEAFSFVSMRAAAISNMVLAIALCATGLTLLCRRVFAEAAHRRVTYLIIAVALWAPLQTGLHYSNISIVVIGLLLVLLSTDMDHHPVLRGVAAGIAVAMKPQVSGLYIILLLRRKRYKELLSCLSTIAVITGVAVARLSRIEPGWWADYQRVIAHFLSVAANVTYDAPGRYGLIMTQALLYPWIGSVVIARYAAIVLACLLFLWWLYVDLRSAARRNDVLSSAALLPIALLPIFQNSYNATLLVVFAVALAMLQRSRATLLAGLFMAGFWIRVAPLMHRLPVRLTDGSNHSMLWNSFVMCFPAWLTLCCTVLALILYTRWVFGKEKEAFGVTLLNFETTHPNIR